MFCRVKLFYYSCTLSLFLVSDYFSCFFTLSLNLVLCFFFSVCSFSVSFMACFSSSLSLSLSSLAWKWNLFYFWQEKVNNLSTRGQFHKSWKLAFIYHSQVFQFPISSKKCFKAVFLLPKYLYSKIVCLAAKEWHLKCHKVVF